MAPAMSKIARLQAADDTNTRVAIDCRWRREWRGKTNTRSALAEARACRAGRRLEDVAEAAHGLDHVHPELAAKPADEHLDGVGIPVEVLVVEMLHDLRARHDPAYMV